MQAFQQLADSLGDHASLNRLRENFTDLPKRWLSRMYQPEDYLFGQVTGDYNYHFSFRLEGGGYFQSGVLIASAETAPGGMPVPLRCRWKRRVAGRPVEIPGVSSNMYQISADDVGTNILVEVEPVDGDDGLFGKACGELGPFELDPATRRSLDNALGLGLARFVTRIVADGQPSQQQQEIAIHASADSIRVVPLQGGIEKQSREVISDYANEFPKVIIHTKETTRFQLVLSDSRTYSLVAPCRSSRDLIALTIRCFHAKKFLPEQTLLQELLPVGGTSTLGGVSNVVKVDDKVDACILLERLTKELNRAMQQKDVSEKILRNTNHEKDQLQDQLMETIAGFTEVIEGIQDQVGHTSAEHSSLMSGAVLEEQVRMTSAQNKALQLELQSGNARLDELRRSRQAAASSSLTAQADVQALREEQQLLQARLRELTSSASTPHQVDQADHIHAHELKRLRQDVEALHNQKEILRRQLADAERERQELQDNFLYVKGQLDKVQMKQAFAAENPSGTSSELQRHRAALHAATEERNRMSVRLESILRELEKDKAYHEQSLERVTAANARLLEEKDRAAKDVAQISRLYAESVKQLQSPSDPLGRSGVFRAESIPYDSVGPDLDEVARLQVELAQVGESLRRKEQENESLKARIRKLAVLT